MRKTKCKSFNNDLLGKDLPWGPYSSAQYWQRSLYDRYKGMCHRCDNPDDKDYKRYGAKGIKNLFVSFSQYYFTLRKDPLWSSFVSNPEMYDIDKDIKKGYGSSYAPDTIMIVLKTDNNDEKLKRQCSSGNITKNFGNNNWTYNKKHKHVVVEFNDGSVKEFNSLDEAGSYFGRTRALIGMWINGKQRILPKYNIKSICFGGR